MTCEEIERHFKQALKDVQRDGGHPDPTLEDDTIPLRDLVGFDSYSALDAEARLGAIISGLGAVPFKSTKDGHEMTIREIVDHLCKRHASEDKRAK